MYVDFLWVKVSGEGRLIERGGEEGSESETRRDVGQLATKLQRNRKCCSVLCVEAVRSGLWQSVQWLAIMVLLR